MQTQTITSTWNATLHHHDAATYKNILIDIDQYLVDVIKETPATTNIGVMSGRMGELIYLFHSAVHTENDELYNFAIDQLEILVDSISLSSTPTFCAGTAGVVWGLFYLEQTGLVEDASAAIDTEVIEYLANWGIQQTKYGHYDYMHAGLSMVLPLLSYYKKTGLFKNKLEELVAALDATKETNEHGYYWRYAIGLPDEAEKVSLGLSHGSPSIVSLLAKISAEGIAVDECNELLTGALNYMLAYRCPEGSAGMYPGNVLLDGSVNAPNSRLGWCYGDMNFAIALHFANKATPNESYVQLINEIMDFCRLKDDAQKAAINESSICHGAAGVAHIYNRFYNAYGGDKFKDATNTWLEITLQKMKKEDGKWWLLNTADYKSQWDTATNTITGISGVGLVLLSAIAPIAPGWDEMYLLNL
ncbi:MAG: hypothetical protein EOP51_06605 [Sphingobacteriales bacterium]|nr:MAG: hypothetical protein EOP51_06605 [Sphingobacteriales bacterium]